MFISWRSMDTWNHTWSSILFWGWHIISLPESIFIWEGQRVQESSVQQHELVVNLSDLQRSKRREMGRIWRWIQPISTWVAKEILITVCLCICSCTYVSFARSELWITLSNAVAALRKLATAVFSGSERKHRSAVQPLSKDFHRV